MNRYLVPLGFFAALVISVLLWLNMPTLIGEQMGKQLVDAGPLVPALIMLLILQISFVIERMMSLQKAAGQVRIGLGSDDGDQFFSQFRIFFTKINGL